MQFKEIAELIEIIGRSSIEEFELERSGVRIRVRKSSPRSESIRDDAGTVAVQRQTREDVPEESSVLPAKKDETAHVFKAPIVGTFYLTPKPDADSFVKVGDRVGKGTVLCIIEAMKIFNQIECDVAGEISKILVDNGQPVEYGEPLFEIRVDA